MAKIIIRWKKSAIGYPRNQVRVIKALGLKRLQHEVEHEDTPSIMGMINKVNHLIEVKELS